MLLANMKNSIKGQIVNGCPIVRDDHISVRTAKINFKSRLPSNSDCIVTKDLQIGTKINW